MKTNKQPWTFEYYAQIHLHKNMSDQENNNTNSPVLSPAVNNDEGYMSDLVAETHLESHFDSLDINVDEQPAIKDENKENDNNNDIDIDIDNRNTSQNNKILAKPAKKHKRPNKNSKDKPRQHQKIEFDALIEQKQENNRLLDSESFAVEVIKARTGASDPQGLSDWYKEQLTLIKEIAIKETEKKLQPSDMSDVIKCNCFLVWAGPEVEKSWLVVLFIFICVLCMVLKFDL